eukprot:6459866-Amphidinium_carterae.1
MANFLFKRQCSTTPICTRLAPASLTGGLLILVALTVKIICPTGSGASHAHVGAADWHEIPRGPRL